MFLTDEKNKRTENFYIQQKSLNFSVQTLLRVARIKLRGIIHARVEVFIMLRIDIIGFKQGEKIDRSQAVDFITYF